ncbi:uncharacterized protein WM277_010827 [Molossus nigricans]
MELGRQEEVLAEKGFVEEEDHHKGPVLQSPEVPCEDNGFRRSEEGQDSYGTGIMKMMMIMVMMMMMMMILILKFSRLHRTSTELPTLDQVKTPDPLIQGVHSNPRSN